MNIEQLLKQIKVCDDTIKTQYDYRKSIIAQFIEENKNFSVGDKVNIKTNKLDENGFVKYIYLNERSGEIQYKFLKMKKNGEPSQHELWLWGDIISITKI